MTSLEDRFTGCLLGGAIGDALGMPVEGLTRDEIAQLGVIRDFMPSRGAAPVEIPLSALGDSQMGDPLKPGQWTDDTQLSLALAVCLLEEGGLFIPEAWAHKLVRWLNASPRNPGLSTLQAAIQLRTSAVMWDESADPEGAGCSPASRVAPIALLFTNATERRRAALLQAQVTHGHPDAQAAALAVSEAVARALEMTPASLAEDGGATLLDSLAATVESESSAFAEFARCLRLAQTLLADNVETETAIRVLGVSAWSREAVPCALYCVARLPADFETLLLTTVNQTGGAVASIAAIAGAVGGALHGLPGIPARWLAGVEEAERLADTARHLYTLRTGPINDPAGKHNRPLDG